MQNSGSHWNMMSGKVVICKSVTNQKQIKNNRLRNITNIEIFTERIEFKGYGKIAALKGQMTNPEHLKISVLIAKSPTSKLRSRQCQKVVFCKMYTIFS